MAEIEFPVTLVKFHGDTISRASGLFNLEKKLVALVASILEAFNVTTVVLSLEKLIVYVTPNG